jgi:zinc transport system substrate-binding protein
MKTWHWAVVLSLFLAACSGEKGSETGTQSADSGKPVVYASNYPLQYFAERISTPIVTVQLPAPAGEDPAFWSPTPEDVVAMQKADLVLLNGASYESWLKNVSLSPSKMVDTSAPLKDRFIPLEGVGTHSHGSEGGHEHSGTAFTTWLDLTMAVEQARAIKDAFASRWPEHGGQFESQFASLAEDLASLDRELEEVVKKDPSVPVLFSHPVYQYFARRYGINGRSVHWEPHEMPSDDNWQDLEALTVGHPAEWMIWEARPSPEIAERLAAQGIQSVVFDPCAGTPDGSDFVSVMRLNVEALSTVFDD